MNQIQRQNSLRQNQKLTLRFKNIYIYIYTKKGRNKFCGNYRKGSKSTQIEKQRFSKELKKGSSKTFNIQIPF